MISLRSATLGCLVALVLAPVAGAVPLGSTVLVDRPSGFGALPFDGFSDARLGRHALSADGCLVAYVSDSDDLLATDEDAAANVYRQNRCAPGTRPVQVNTSAAGAPAEAGSFATDATISADGRYVAFRTSAENLHPAARGALSYIFVKDLQTGSVELASRGHGADGAPVHAPESAVISGNGGIVLFVAEGVVDAVNVAGVAGETNAYVRSRAGDTVMVSVTAGGARGGAVDDGTYGGDIDYSGRNVVFVSENRLDPAADTDDSEDAYMRRGIGEMSPATQLVSFTAGADGADEVAISSDASRIAWADGELWVSTCSPCGAATRVDTERPGGTNNSPDDEPFFAQTAAGAPQRVYWATRSALDPADANGENDVYSAVLTGGADPVRLATAGVADGRVGTASGTDDVAVVVFMAERARTLPGGDGVHDQVFQRAAGAVTNLVQVAGIQPRVSTAGSTELRPLHAVSDDGRLVAFASEAPALGAPFAAQGRAAQVLARDVVAGATTLVSVAANGSAPANDHALDASVDAAGRRIAFTSAATNLVPGVPPGRRHVYVRDLRTRTTVLVDRVPGGAPTSGGAERPQISGDGTKVVFESSSDDLPGGVFAGPAHIYRVGLATGATTLVDRSAGGMPGDREAGSPDISFDGNRIAFESDATNLGGPPGDSTQVYVRDVTAGTTTWASVVQTPTIPQPYALFPSLGGDGNRVAFEVRSGAVTAVSGTRIFLRDLARRTTTLASPPGAGFADDEQPSVSRDGSKVAFARFPDRGFGMTVVRDLSTGALVRADRRNGATTAGRLGAHGVSLNRDGSCVAFASGSDDLVSPSYGSDFEHVFLRALTRDCPAPSATGARDTTAPRITGARVTNRRFALARRRTARIARVKRGTKFVFRLSEAARTTITIARRKRRARFVKVVALTRAGTRQGVNRVAFTGRLGKRVLRRGPYRAAIVSTDRAGNRSRRVFVRFTVLRPKR